VGQLDRITQNPEVIGGKACIRGMRVTVGMIVGQIGTGRSIEEVLSDFPVLNATTSCRRCVTRHGGLKSAKWCCPADEIAGGHESVAAWVKTLNEERLGLAMKIKVVVHEAEEGGYWAEVPAIPGCATQGESMEELLRNVREAIEGCLSVDIPEPKPDEKLRILEIAV
jgi:predicted RNase H-like HicB family nuclease/uncharacterized protein (DUF433 family)